MNKITFFLIFGLFLTGSKKLEAADFFKGANSFAVIASALAGVGAGYCINQYATDSGWIKLGAGGVGITAVPLSCIVYIPTKYSGNDTQNPYLITFAATEFATLALCGGYNLKNWCYKDQGSEGKDRGQQKNKLTN